LWKPSKKGFADKAKVAHMLDCYESEVYKQTLIALNVIGNHLNGRHPVRQEFKAMDTLLIMSTLKPK